VHAVDAHSGALRWKTALGGRIYSTAYVAETKLYIGCGDGKLYCLDSRGKILWSAETGNAIDSSPALDGDMVIVGSEDFSVYAFDASTGALRWKFPTGLGIASSPAVNQGIAVAGSKDGYLYAFESRSGQLRWKVRVGEVVTSPPVFAEGVVCIQAAGLIAVDIGAGKLVWRAPLGGAVQSAPVLSGDAIYITSLDGEVYALE
jgi:outer membrane protein assembly factor BamB